MITAWPNAKRKVILFMAMDGIDIAEIAAEIIKSLRTRGFIVVVLQREADLVRYLNQSRVLMLIVYASGMLFNSELKTYRGGLPPTIYFWTLNMPTVKGVIPFCWWSLHSDANRITAINGVLIKIRQRELEKRDSQSETGA